MSSVKAVRQLKEDLLKEQARPPGDGRNEKILNILQLLQKVKMDLTILSETLVGAAVSKLKNHPEEAIASTARALVKSWKGVAKQAQTSPAMTSAMTIARVESDDSKSPPKNVSQQNSNEGVTKMDDTEWHDLPPVRINIRKKLHEIFLLSESELSKEINESAVKQLCFLRAEEVETAIDHWSKGVKQTYTEKSRTLVFNLKKNGPLRNRVIIGEVTPEVLPKMSSEELQTEEKAKQTWETVKSLQESRRLDWEQANEDKINEQCGIRGDLKKASLFTCGRCKSTKTTSTQKQTRSADEPMTVFVLCLNCGKRWKC